MRKLTSLFLLTFIFISSCKNKQENLKDEINNLFKFREYIAQVSSGTISAYDDIKVVLRNQVADWENNMELPNELIKLSPKVTGKVVAINNQTLSFIPEKPLDHNTIYNVSLKLDKIIEDLPGQFSDFDFQIKTHELQFNLYNGNLQSYNKSLMYMEGSLRSSDKLDPDIIDRLVSARQNGKELVVKFEKSSTPMAQYSFKIDSIQRLENDSELLISWNGNTLNMQSEGENKIKIPGKNNFTIIDVRVSNGESQYLEINFSDPLKKEQKFNGLVTLQGSEELKFNSEGNVLKIYPGKPIKGIARLEVFQGIQSVEGYKLKTSFTDDIAFEQLKPEVRLLSNGNILPSSNNLKINFEAVNLKAVDVRVIKIFEDNILQFLQFNEIKGNQYLRNVARPVARKTIQLQNGINPENSGDFRAYALDLKDLINPEPGAVYRVELNIKPQYNTYKCEETNFEEIKTVEENFDEEEETSSWDGIEDNYYYYDSYGYDYNWNERDNPCHTSYYRNKKVAINVLASDIALTVKKGEKNNYFISTNNIVSSEPVSGANISFFNFQQQKIGEASSDKNGFSFFDADRPAYFAIVENNGQKAYVKLNDGNALSVSKFDVSGVKLEKGIKGFLYGERGVWRPGDTLFLSFILNDKAYKFPENHPVKLELKDPYGKLVNRSVVTSGLNNFYNFVIPTNPNAPTGNWQARVSVGGASFTRNVKIETIKPNRLKIKTDFDRELLSPSQPISGTMEVAWLHGAVAKKLKADVLAKFRQQTTTFKKFPGYVFDDPSRSFEAEEFTVFSGNIDNAGKANFTLKPQLSSKAPGMLKAAFISKVYENGGDFSTDVFTSTYSPYSTYVGLNTPRGDKTRGMLLTDTKHRFEVVTVNEKGRAKSVKGLKASIYKVKWRWWWETSADNLSSYNSSSYSEEVFSTNLDTDNSGKASFDFELKYPEWGRYLVRIEDTEGGHATGKTIYIDWPGWAGRSRKGDPGAATMLAFSTDKESYSVGENAVITFPSSKGGRALVTVENGTEVLEAMWINPEKGETKFELPISKEYAPNVYIAISLIQPHANTLNDSPIRMYGTVPLMVEDPNTKLQPKIAMPTILRPEEKATIKVSEKSGKAMTYTLAIVDDGLLDLTRFKTPDPWSSFYAREALGVKTWDIYDDVIGAFGGRVDQVFSIGGDQDVAGAKNKKANRFKPMVIYLGPFHLKKGETKNHIINVPKYVGSVRTMVIAGNSEKEAYGIAENTTPVRKPLMVLASLPRKITPGEKIILPVTVFAMETKVKNVTVSVKNSKAYRIIGESTRKVSFKELNEKMVYFELEAASLNGIGKVQIEASGNGERASYEVEIDVLNPNPVSTESKEYTIDPNSSVTIDLETFGMEGSNTAQLEFSSLPSVNFNGRMAYLLNYPHGCLEQTTSSAFPQLFLSDIFDLTYDKKKKIQLHVEDAIKKIGNHQLPGGGITYWPGQNYVNDWVTSYTGHFLLEAESKGYVLPLGFKNSWISYQKKKARQWRKSQTSSDLNQAYRLYTLALAGNPEVSVMNRLRETSNLSNEARHRLAAAYALLGQKNAAKSIFNTANIDFQPVRYDYHTYGSEERNRAMALETLILLENTKEAQDLAKIIAKRLNENRWMSTHSVAYSLLSMAKFAEYIGGKGIKVTYTQGGTPSQIDTDKVLAIRDVAVGMGNTSVLVKNQRDATLFVRTITQGILPVGVEKEQEQNLSAQISYKGKDGKKISVSNLPQGTNFVAEVTITNKKGESIKDVALMQIFPSGWEIVNTRFTDFGVFEQNEATYTDIRDDRVNFYFDLKKYKSKTFRILLNASYLGKYYLPGIQGEAMYDNDYMIRTKGQWITVSK